MIKKWLFIFSVFCLSKTNAQNNAIFNGGSADGFSVNLFTQPDIAANNIFNGGNADGFSVNCFAQPTVAANNTVFNGGNADGFSVNCFVQPTVAANNTVFNGGNADGFSVNCFVQPTVAANNTVFNGGNADGFSVNCFVQPTVAANNTVFNGGNADGFSVNCFAQPTVAANNTVFNGGNADGFSVNCFAQPTVAANNTVFNGGNADGFAFSRVGSLGNEVPLPIELLSFSANCYNQNIVITWTTASETNNDYFTIEQSADAANWIIIKTVDGAGNSSTVKNYSFTDSITRNAVSYFRLKQTDFDGKFKYSKIITIRSCKENADLNSLTVYPNPANGIINFLFNGDIAQVRSIEVFNVLGERVYYSGRYQSFIDLTNKSAGLYFVHFNLSAKTITAKIVIER
jgi:Secretion system C-terminal sorting domain